MSVNHHRLVLVFGAVVLILSACAAPAASPAASSPIQPAQATLTDLLPPGDALPAATPQYSLEDLENWAKTGAAAVWPAYIPAEIPQPEGVIRKTMEGDLSLRIFYASMSPAAFEQWLSLLEQQGFSLEYVVYIQEGFPDTSEERIKQGDFDAVKITKGDYQLEITYGSTDPVLDIAVSGFEFPGYSNTAPTPSGPVWPVEYALDIPQPARCPLLSIEVVPAHDYRILCQPADAQVLTDYQAALQSAGYLPNTVLPAANGSLDGSIYAWGSREISFEQPSPELLIITIADTTARKSAWPDAFTGSVPAPANCPIQNVLPTGPGSYLISCAGANEQVVADYLTLLQSVGFTESSRMQTQSGELVQVKLENDSWQVNLMISALNAAWNLNIKIDPR